MKTSNIKPNFSREQVQQLNAVSRDILKGSIKQLTEGHFSQVFSYKTKAREKLVIRLGLKLYSFDADRYAHDHFNSTDTPIPKVLQIGEVEPGLYFCISE